MQKTEKKWSRYLFYITALLILITGIADSSCTASIRLITYGAATPTIEGDNDHKQEIVIHVPKEIKSPLWLRLFDPDTGGSHDAEELKGWNTRTLFELYGEKLIHSESFSHDPEKDDKWHTFAGFSPENGIPGDKGIRRFSLWIKGLEGDDGNVFDIMVSLSPDENKIPPGVRLLSFEPTVRLLEREDIAEMKFFLPSGVSEIIVNNFDSAKGRIYVTTPFRSRLMVTPSGQDEWKHEKIQMNKMETGRWCALNYTGGRERPNDASFFITKPNGEHIPIHLPVYIQPRKNHRPDPDIKVTYLPEPCEVVFDASGSKDKDGDKLSYFWDFGDGRSDTGIKVTHLYEYISDFEVTLIVTDDSGHIGNSGFEKKKIHLNHPPSANPGSDIIGAPGMEILFSGAESKDPDGKIILYEWNFGDGTTAKGKQLSHVFKKPGTYTVKLKVTDDAEVPCNWDEKTLTVKINAPPIVIPGKDRKGAAGELISFSPEKAFDPDGHIQTFFWDFGDGHQAEGEEVIHKYTSPGKYQAKLTVVDDAGVENSTASGQFFVNINAPPYVSAGEDRRAAAGEKVRFDASQSFDPDGKIISWLWDFGDGSKSRKRQVNHKYDAPGTYTVTLEAEDNSRTSSSKQKDSITIIVNHPPQAEAGKDRHVAADDIVRFSAAESFDPDGKIISWHWDFGDGEKAEGQEVIHAYIKPGIYTVSLELEDDSGTSSAKQKDSLKVKVNHPPKADAGLSRTLTSSTVDFDARGSGDPDGKIILYEWDFGDNSTGTGKALVHEYARPGTYKVTLRVTDDSGTASHQAEDNITIIVNHRPIADAGPDIQTGPGQTLYFDGTRSIDPDGSILEMKWDFGDGTAGTGPKISHTYEKSGIYMVRLNVYDNTGHAEAFDIDSCRVVVNAPPVSQIQVYPQGPGPVFCRDSIHGVSAIASPGQEIRFEGNASWDTDGSIEEYHWTFIRPGTAFSESVQGQVHTRSFKEPGIYTAVLCVMDNSGADNARACNQEIIRINHPPQAPKIQNIAACSHIVEFDGSGAADPDGDPLEYMWDFGDGSPSKYGPRTVHTYASPGTYPVMLRVNDNTGLPNAADQVSFSVTINSPPVADAGDNQVLCAGDAAVFSAARSYDPKGGFLRYFWDFGDGTTASGLNPTKIFKKPGTFPVTLTIKDDSGLPCNTSSDQIYVQAARAPVASAGGDITDCAGSEIFFDGSQSWDVDGVVNRFLWDFGDGNTGGGIRPVHVYAEPGIYTVSLSITGDISGFCDNEDTDKIQVTILEAPKPKIISIQEASPGRSILFDGSKSSTKHGEIISLEWDFGDGNKGTGKTVSHTYKKPGKYLVTLTITTNGEQNCRTSTARTRITINHPPAAEAGPDCRARIYDMLTFNGSGSSDKDGAVSSYEWDFGDGTKGSGLEVRHQYDKPGTYKVKLRVTDNSHADNNQDEDELTVIVYEPLKSVIKAAEKGCAGQKITFIALSASNHEPESGKPRFSWDFGDGRKAEGATVSHLYQTPGIYECALMLNDENGNHQSTSNHRVIINNTPSACAGTDQIICPGTEVRFNGSGSSDPDGQIKSWFWDFGDGESAEGPEVSHIFKQGRRNYTVRLTVTDDSGTACASDTDTLSVKVNNPPKADAGPDRQVFTGGAHDIVLFDGTRSHDPDGDSLMFSWDFGDGIQDMGAQVLHAFARPGTYTVRLKVNDGMNTECSEAWDELEVVVRKRGED